jgi:hypothetical protein
MKHEPVAVVGSILAGLYVLFGGFSGIEALNHNPSWAAAGSLGVLAVAAAQVGLNFYVRGRVTPVEDGVNGFGRSVVE